MIPTCITNIFVVYAYRGILNLLNNSGKASLMRLLSPQVFVTNNYLESTLLVNSGVEFTLDMKLLVPVFLQTFVAPIIPTNKPMSEIIIPMAIPELLGLLSYTRMPTPTPIINGDAIILSQDNISTNISNILIMRIKLIILNSINRQPSTATYLSKVTFPVLVPTVPSHPL